MAFVQDAIMPASLPIISSKNRCFRYKVQPAQPQKLIPHFVPVKAQTWVGSVHSIEDIVASIENEIQTSDIRINNLSLDVKDVHLLRDAFARRLGNPNAATLLNLELVRCNLDAEKLRMLTESLPLKSLLTFTLRWNELDDKAGPILTEIIDKSPQLIVLDLYQNRQLGSWLRPAILPSVCCHAHLRNLGLGATEVSEDDREALRKAVMIGKSQRARMALVLCSSHLVSSTIAKNSMLKFLPMDLIRMLVREFLYS